MIDFDKLNRLEAQVARMEDARRTRSGRYRDHIARSKELRTAAVHGAAPDFQTMQLSELLAFPDHELHQVGVDTKVLRRAALARRLAEDELFTSPQEEAEFAALSTLARNCRIYAGEDQ